jgi:bla regulator protein BlaR1
MMAAWLAYAVVVSALLAAAALVAEKALRARGWPGRWPWLVALVGSVALPAVARVAPVASATPLPPLPGSRVLTMIPIDAGTPAGGAPSLELVALWGWAAVSGLLLLFVAAGAYRLWRERRGWSRRVVEGVDVLVSRDTGPAALGFLRGRVVVPEWALALEPRSRRLLLLHESEHVRAGDPQLAALGLMVCAMVPWNLPLWWQLRRLRLAIELDCDDRVLRRSRDRATYGALLLSMGQKRAGLALALAEPTSMLERRIRMIAETRKRRTLRAAGLAAVSGLILAVACETPAPTDAEDGPAGQVTEASSTAPGVDPAGALGDERCDPAIVIDGVSATEAELGGLVPEGIERIEVLKGAKAAAAGTCAIIAVTTRPAGVGEAGTIREVRRAPGAEGAEATEGTARVVREAAVREALSAGSTDAPTGFTPMTERPRIRNPEAVQAALRDLYPPLLRDAGIGGTANVWAYIDETGTVTETRINTSAGHPALDAAAQKIIEKAEFTPARNGAEVVAVWVALPVTFETQ